MTDRKIYTKKIIILNNKAPLNEDEAAWLKKLDCKVSFELTSPSQEELIKLDKLLEKYHLGADTFM